MDLDESAADILRTVENIEEQLEELRRERDKLFEANQRLVELVERLEDELSGYVTEEDVEDFDIGGYEYSFKQGWRETDDAHRERMELDRNVDADEVQEQINEIRDSVKRVQQRDQE